MCNMHVVETVVAEVSTQHSMNVKHESSTRNIYFNPFPTHRFVHDTLYVEMEKYEKLENNRRMYCKSKQYF